MQSNRLRALLLAGSPKRHSHTRAIVDVIAVRLIDMGVESVIWHQAEQPLPIMTTEQRSHHHLITDKHLLEFLKNVKRADILVFGTPVYHGSFSGGLKNALDWLSSSLLADKIVGLACNSGGFRKTFPLVELRAITRSVHAHAVRTEVATCDSDFESDQDNGYYVRSPEIIARVDEFVFDLVEFSRIFHIREEHVREMHTQPNLSR